MHQPAKMNGIGRFSTIERCSTRLLSVEPTVLYLKDIVSVVYDSELQRLTVVFDACRKVVFYAVPPDVCERLANSAWPKEGYEAHVLGKFAWTEIGALGPDELCRAGNSVR